MGNCHVGSTIMQIVTTTAVKEGTTDIIDKYRRIFVKGE